jgi:hypothetical protein
MKLNPIAAARKAAVTRKRLAAARKAVLTRTRQAVGKSAVRTRKRNALARNGVRVDMLALSIRQPYVEQIMRGTRRIEYRSMLTHIRGRVLIYASMKPDAEEQFKKLRMRPGELPTSVIVGSVEIVKCTGQPGEYRWHLANPRRFRTRVPPQNQPSRLGLSPSKLVTHRT